MRLPKPCRSKPVRAATVESPLDPSPLLIARAAAGDRVALRQLEALLIPLLLDKARFLLFRSYTPNQGVEKSIAARRKLLPAKEREEVAEEAMARTLSILRPVDGRPSRLLSRNYDSSRPLLPFLDGVLKNKLEKVLKRETKPRIRIVEPPRGADGQPDFSILERPAAIPMPAITAEPSRAADEPREERVRLQQAWALLAHLTKAERAAVLVEIRKQSDDLLELGEEELTRLASLDGEPLGTPEAASGSHYSNLRRARVRLARLLKDPSLLAAVA